MKIQSLIIGKYKITKEAILKIAFSFFSLGILIGVYFAAKEDNPHTTFQYILPIFFIPTILLMYKPIKKGIIRVK